MNRLVISFLLAAFSGSAAAEWVLVGENYSANYYADPATIRRAGTMVKMWALFDFKNAQKDVISGKPFLSSKYQSAFDCKEERVRILYFSNHSGQMGDGGLVSYDDSGDDKWSPVPPESVRELFWKFACGKK